MNTFFVYLDILGFKNIINNNTEESLDNIINKFCLGVEDSVERSRTIEFTDLNTGKEGEYKINFGNLNYRLIADSIFMWGENDNFPTFRNLLNVTTELLSFGIKNGFPLRGAMTYGEIIINKLSSLDTESFSKESFNGQALEEVYRLENEMEWSGCILTSAAWRKIREIWSEAITSDKDPNAYFNRYPYLIWYSVPFISGIKPSITINWNLSRFYKPFHIIFPSLVKQGFCAYGKDLSNEHEKLDETLKFLEYTNHLFEFGFSDSSTSPASNLINEKLELRKKIPVPNSDY